MLVSGVSHPTVTTCILVTMVAALAGVLVVLVRLDKAYGGAYLNPHGDMLRQMELGQEWRYENVLRERKRSGWAALRKLKRRLKNTRLKQMDDSQQKQTKQPTNTQDANDPAGEWRVRKDGDNFVVFDALSGKPLLRLTSTFVHKQPLPQQNIDLIPAKPFKLDAPCLPQLLVIGAQKGGTTSWHQYLKQGYHPNIIVPHGLKETDFFSKHIERNMTFSDYLRLFPGNVNGSHLNCNLTYHSGNQFPYIRAEASPNYLVHPYAARRIKAKLPHAKIIVMLRDPIARLVSAYNMKWQQQKCKDNAWRMRDCFKLLLNTTSLPLLRKDWETGLRSLVTTELSLLNTCYATIRPKLLALTALSHRDRLLSSVRLHASVFSSCFSFSTLSPISRWRVLEDKTFLYRSIYVDQLYHYFSQFPPSRFQIWSSEAFQKRPRGYMTQMVHWLRLPLPNTTNSTGKERGEGVIESKHHVRDYVSTVPKDVSELLKEFFKEHNERLVMYLEEMGFKESVRMINRHFVN